MEQVATTNSKSIRLLLRTAILMIFALVILAVPVSAQDDVHTLPVANIVLVHGAWADGSSWSAVIGQLQEVGYNVTAVQIPLTSLDDDVATVRGVLANQTGATILVGHSYGGAVITQLGADAPNVIGLVYIAAFAPDEGETMGALTGTGEPPAGASAIRPDARGFLWLDPQGFVDYFAADVDPIQAQVLASVQKPIFAASLVGDQAFGTPSWSLLPSWYLVATDDQMIPPDAERFMAQRMGATVVEVASSHVPMVSHPDDVANLIMQAAEATAQ